MDAASSYRRRALEGTSKVGLVVMLYQSAGVSLRRGITALEAGDIEARTRALNHVLALVTELKSVLDFERGGSIARQFEQFYQVVERAILDAGIRQDAQPLQQVLEQFVRLQEAWQQVDALPAAPAGDHPGLRPNTAGEVRPTWQA